MPNLHPVPGKCNGRTTDKLYCAKTPSAGSKRCELHAGVSRKKIKERKMVVDELRNWGLGDTTIDPGDLMLRLVTQSANRVQLYSRCLMDAYDAAERLHHAEQQDPQILNGVVVGDDYQTARQDLQRIFKLGGVGALVGNVYTATRDGDIFATGEAIRGLAKLEAEERDRAMKFAAAAVGGRLGERMVALAERHADMLFAAIAVALDAIGATPDQRSTAMTAIAASIGTPSTSTIDGQVIA